MLLSNHRIKESNLDLLCHGYGSEELTRELWRTEFSRRLLLFDSVVDLVTLQPELLEPLPSPFAAINLLNEIDDADREVFREVLLHPHVGGWAAYVLRRSLGLADSQVPLWVDIGSLHAVAFVAAVRCGRDWKTVIPARGGEAMLPGLGMAVFPGTEPWGLVEAETRAGAVTLRCRGSAVHLTAGGLRPSGDAEWLELRRLRVGAEPALTVLLDDIDPFRDLGDPVEPQRLSAAGAQRWESLLRDAWEILCTGHRASARAMAGGVVCLVPFAGDGGQETRSASTGEAFGSVLVSEPSDAVALAVALVHEFAHIQLGGLLHLLPVTLGGEEEVFYAPWRDDPRPFPGLVQGIYAFVNICDFWRKQARVQHGADSEFEYLYSRLQVEEALRMAAGSGRLTGVGERLVAGLTERVSGWPAVPLSGPTAGAARLVAAGHRAGWRIRHLTPATETVDRLAAAWSRGEVVPLLDPAYRVVRGERRWSQGRLALARRWARSTAAVFAADLRAFGVDDADASLLNGEHAAAATAFARRIGDNPADLDAWVGLGLAFEGPAGRALGEHPALLRAVYEAVRGSAPDPVALATWLGRGMSA